MVDKFQKPQHILPVIQRLTNAHQHNIGDLPSGIQLRKQHLIEHLTGRQIAHLTGNRGGTEGAAHAAAHLRGNTDRVAVTVLHQYRFNAVAVRQPPQVFDGAVQPADLLARHGGHGNRALRF